MCKVTTTRVGVSVVSPKPGRFLCDVIAECVTSQPDGGGRLYVCDSVASGTIEILRIWSLLKSMIHRNVQMSFSICAA